MIARPPGWVAIPGVTTQTLIGPDGGHAVIRYTERVRPLRRLSEIVAARLRDHAALAAPRVGAPERTVTLEGEHAAFVTVDGELAGAPVQLAIGVVFGDDFYALIEGVTRGPDRFAQTATTVRELALSDRHVLGRRRRRYEYAPPADWQPIVRGFTTDWLAPGFPKHWGLIVVYAASPVAPLDEVDLGALQQRAVERGFAIDAATPPLELENAAGMVGLGHEAVGVLAGSQMLRAFVSLTDRAYVYSAELMSRTPDDWPAHRDAFAAVWRSFVPVPGGQPTPVSAAFDLWAE